MWHYAPLFAIPAIVAAVATAPAAAAVPESGVNGLCPNAVALMHYIADTYPGVQSAIR